MILFNSTKA